MYIIYSIHVTSYPLYLRHDIHYVWQHNTVCCWYHTRHMCDIICTTVISHPLYHTKSQYLWCHIHCKHDITHTVSHIAPTVSLSLQTLHWFHTDTIPTSVWHYTHSMWDTICTLYNIISTPYVITLPYLWHHSHYIWNHIQYLGPHIHYTCDITAIYLCHHSHSIDNITHTLYDITLG